MIKFTFFLSILSITLVLNCSKKDIELQKFETEIPSNDLLILNNWVSAYDEIVKINYIDQNKDINNFLLDLVKDDTLNWNLGSNKICNLIEEFNNSTLEHRYINLNYDTLFKVVGRNFWGEYTNENDTIIAGIKEDKDTAWIDESILGIDGIDKMIEYKKKEGYRETLNESSFLSALEKINTSDSIILSYIHERKLIGYSNSKSLAVGAIEYNLGKKKGVIKKILVFAIFIEYIRFNNGC